MTLGAVVMMSRSNSRVSRSKTISRCRRPKKPQRNPKPSAWLLSCSTWRAESLSCSFNKRIAQIFKVGRVDRINPGKYDGADQFKAGQGFWRGNFCRVMVSPILTSSGIFDGGDTYSRLRPGGEYRHGSFIRGEDPDFAALQSFFLSPSTG